VLFISGISVCWFVVVVSYVDRCVFRVLSIQTTKLSNLYSEKVEHTNDMVKEHFPFSKLHWIIHIYLRQ